MAYSLPRVLAG